MLSRPVRRKTHARIECGPMDLSEDVTVLLASAQAGDKAAARKELEVLAVKGAQLPWKGEVDQLLKSL